MSACLYLHGFLSSPQSQKAQQLVSYFQQNLANDELVIPALPFEPAAAIQLAEQTLQQLQQQHDQVYLIGSSLGGFYATYLAEKYRLPAALINPAVRPFELFADYLGPNTHFYTGEVYELTMEHIDQLQALNIDPIQQPQNLLLLLQTGDETLDYRQAAQLYRACPSWTEGGGNHSFEDFISRMPMVLDFVRRHYNPDESS